MYGNKLTSAEQENDVICPGVCVRGGGGGNTRISTGVLEGVKVEFVEGFF